MTNPAAFGAGGGTPWDLAGPAVSRGRSSGMYRLLIPSLGRGLLRAAARRCRICSARLLPGPAGGRALELVVRPSQVAPHGGGLGLLPLLAGEGREPGGDSGAGTGAQPGPVTSEPLPAALAWFSRPTAAEEEEELPGAGGAAAKDAADEAEAEIIQLLKRAKVRRPCRCALLSPVSRDGGSEGKSARN